MFGTRKGERAFRFVVLVGGVFEIAQAVCVLLYWKSKYFGTGKRERAFVLVGGVFVIAQAFGVVLVHHAEYGARELGRRNELRLFHGSCRCF